jgi:hypothetical protein
MLKALGLFAVFALTSAMPPQLRAPILHTVQPLAADECCRVCHKGKACGNSCISREKSCHQPPGCACDE